MWIFLILLLGYYFLRKKSRRNRDSLPDLYNVSSKNIVKDEFKQKIKTIEEDFMQKLHEIRCESNKSFVLTQLPEYSHKIPTKKKSRTECINDDRKWEAMLSSIQDSSMPLLELPLPKVAIAENDEVSDGEFSAEFDEFSSHKNPKVKYTKTANAPLRLMTDKNKRLASRTKKRLSPNLGLCKSPNHKQRKSKKVQFNTLLGKISEFFELFKNVKAPETNKKSLENILDETVKLLECYSQEFTSKKYLDCKAFFNYNIVPFQEDFDEMYFRKQNNFDNRMNLENYVFAKNNSMQLFGNRNKMDTIPSNVLIKSYSSIGYNYINDALPIFPQSAMSRIWKSEGCLTLISNFKVSKSAFANKLITNNKIQPLICSDLICKEDCSIPQNCDAIRQPNDIDSSCKIMNESEFKSEAMQACEGNAKTIQYELDNTELKTNEILIDDNLNTNISMDNAAKDTIVPPSIKPEVQNQIKLHDEVPVKKINIETVKPKLSKINSKLENIKPKVDCWSNHLYSKIKDVPDCKNVKAKSSNRTLNIDKIKKQEKEKANVKAKSSNRTLDNDKPKKQEKEKAKKKKVNEQKIKMFKY